MLDTKPAWATIVDQILDERGSTRRWLARRIGMDESQFSRLMNNKPIASGSYYQLTPEIKKAIRHALDVPESLIFGPSNGDSPS